MQEDEIDLRELFQTIMKRKWFIFIFTALVTIGATIYTFMNNPIPIYQGKVLVEIGEVQSEKFGTQSFDNPNNLSKIIDTIYKTESNVPQRTNNLLEIVIKNSNKKLIKENLELASDYIIKKHQEKSKYYKNYIMTKQIGTISINDKPINMPKKKLIITVAFVSGFILSIFLVFFMEFINGMRKEEEKN